MFYILAAFLIQPAAYPQAVFSAEKIAMSQSSEISMNTEPSERPMFVSLAPPDMPAEPVMESENTSVPESAGTVAESPAELSAASLPAALIAVNPRKPLTVSVNQLQAEDRNRERVWMGLGLASHGAATFDAWSTRNAITTAGAHETNPLLRPFSGNASIYLAVQVGPAVMDYVSKKMMYSSHAWMRRAWWVPQGASFVGSLLSGAHNMGVRPAAN